MQMSELEAKPEALGSDPTETAQSNKPAEALTGNEAPLEPDLDPTVAEKT